jgi:hypothetical protein
MPFGLRSRRVEQGGTISTGPLRHRQARGDARAPRDSAGASTGRCHVAANERLVRTSLPESMSTHDATATAARRLRGAYDAVQELFDLLHATRQQKIDAGQQVRKLEHGETDLLRAAILFAGAGLDSTLKELLRVTLPRLIDQHKPAADKLKQYASQLVDEQPKAAKRLLASLDADAGLRQEYIESLVNPSLQGANHLVKVRDVLGLKELGELTTTNLKTTGVFFTARNQIAHELDLKVPMGRGDSTRRPRPMSTTRDEVDLILRISAAFVINTNELLLAPQGM